MEQGPTRRISDPGDPFRLVGTVIDSRYRVLSVVGEGGFGVVYAGHHLAFDHAIAIKCLKVPAHFNGEARAVFLERFKAEGKLLSKLSQNPGIVRVFDYGLVTTGGLDVPYLVLEWLHGHTLEDHLDGLRTQGRPRMDPAEAVRLLLPAVEAIAFAHGERVVHRDIKPANLFVVDGKRGPTLKVLDFGIAKAMQDGEHATMMASGTSSGFHAFSPPYGAPEQFHAKRFGETGPWTDVHALGLVLSEMLSGRRAFVGDDFPDLFQLATGEARPSPAALGVAVPPALEALCARCLALAPAQRFHDAGALLAELQALAAPQASPAPHRSPLEQLAGATQPMAPSLVALAERASQPDLPPARAAMPSAPSGLERPSSTVLGEPLGLGVAQTAASMHAPQRGASMPQPMQPGVPSPIASPQPTAPGAQASRDVSGMQPAYPPPQALTPAGAAFVPAAVATPRRSLRWPLFAGLGLLAAGGVIAAVLLLRSTSREHAPSASASASTQARLADGVTQFASIELRGREVRGISPLPPATAAQRWHYSVSVQGGAVTKVSRVSPSGQVHRTYTLEAAPSGRIMRELNGAGVELAAQTLSPDGTLVQTGRDMVRAVDGCAAKKLSWDAEGRVVEELCLDDAAQPIVDSSGCQKKRQARDAEGRVTSTKCLFADGSPATFADGGHEHRDAYDSAGNLVKRTLHDASGAPAASEEGCWGYGGKFDAAGNRVEFVCMGQAGELVDTGGGVAGRRYQFDANGCEVSDEFVGLTGASVPLPDGVARFATKRDALCEALRVERYDAKGQRIGGGSPAVIDRKLDAKLDVIEERCTGAKGEPVSCMFGEAGDQGSVVRYERDEHGRVVREKGFSLAGAASRRAREYPHELRYSYGSDGRRTVRAAFDEGGRAALLLGNVHRTTYAFDKNGGIVSERFFGADGAPVLSSVGCAEIRQGFDALHRLESIECRNASGAQSPASLCRNGVCWPTRSARVVIERPAAGTRGSTFNVFYDAAGQVVQRLDCSKKRCHR
jgi:serine/threonine protein kinase